MRIPMRTGSVVRAQAAALAIVAVLAAGCATDTDDTGTMPAGTTSAETTVADTTAPSAPSSTAEPTAAEGTVFPAGDVDPGLSPWVDDASAELAARLGIDVDEVEVSAAVLVVWPDASLGCPEPDMAYATVLTDGAVIELGVGGAVYRYHAGGSTEPFLCPRPIDTAPQRA